MNRIFIVEDDATIAQKISAHLENWGYQTQCAENFAEIMPQFFAFDPHLVLMDISLPHYNGYHWCTEIRKHSKLPIVFLSSANDNMNIVMAMNLGGDDFITKPFDLNVLTAKLQATLRRAYTFQNEVSVISHNGVLLDLGSLQLSYRGQCCSLTKNDFRIMRILMENATHVVSREEIIRYLWEEDNFIDDNTLTVNINRLRKKLEEIALTDFIVTKKGLGYQIP